MDAEIITKENTLPVPATDKQVAMTPAGLLEIAVTQGADLDKLEKLMDLQERWDANEAKKAYVHAMSGFHSESINLIKDKDNSQYKSKYVSKGNLVKTACPFLSKYGLSHRFDITQEGDAITVSCILTHEMGHSEKVSMKGQPDKSGAKNPIQQIKSTKTYLEIATFESITGLASSDTLDDDGNASGKPVELITSNQVADIGSLMQEVKGNGSQFCKYFKIDSVENLPAGSYQKAVSMLEAKREK